MIGCAGDTMERIAGKHDHALDLNRRALVARGARAPACGPNRAYELREFNEFNKRVSAIASWPLAPELQTTG